MKLSISQAQIRIIKSVLQSKANESVAKANKLWVENERTNKAKIREAGAVVFRKHKAKLAASIRLVNNGWDHPYPELDPAALQEFIAERDEVIKSVVTKGTGTKVSVDIPSLGISGCGSWRNQQQNALHVPDNEVEQWRNLARKIDSAFMDGDAKRLLYIIEDYKAK